MVKHFLYALTLLASLAVSAEEWKKDIPYYDKDFARSGNVEYLNAQCKLDLRLPSQQKDFPTVVFFHGGGMTRGRKYCPGQFNPEKVAVAGVEYRFSGDKAACPDYLYDAAAATAWVIRHIAEYGGDPKKVYLSGHSAGGYLCAMLALDKRYLNKFGAEPLQLAGVFPLSGQMTTHFQILAERRKKDPSTPTIWIDEYAPIGAAGKNNPPLYLIVGDSGIEFPARVEENLLLAARMKRCFKNDKVQVFQLGGLNHGTMLTPGVILANDFIMKQCYPKNKK